MTIQLDELDRKILQELQKDGRARAVDLAQKLRAPRMTVVNRIGRLEASGVITGYAAHLNHAALGRPVKAIVMVSFSPAAGRDQKDVARKIAAVAGVEQVDIISGEWDILVTLRAESIEAVGNVVLEKIRREPGVERTLTSSVFATIKELR